VQVQKANELAESVKGRRLPRSVRPTAWSAATATATFGGIKKAETDCGFPGRLTDLPFYLYIAAPEIGKNAPKRNTPVQKTRRIFAFSGGYETG
jgi:hypothetical protein